MKILVTGGCGFIGANFLVHSLERFPDHHFVNLDALTYAANPMSLAPIADSPRYAFERGDVADDGAVTRVFEAHRPELVVHFAAESHVDRSIAGPRAFVDTNIQGTFTLLEACRRHWKAGEGRFLQVSTDEVYGSLETGSRAAEVAPCAPSSPYSASKAAADHLVRAWHRTYGLPTTITRGSNTYGPCQFPEKLIPLMILEASEGRPLPIYGDGSNLRDWIHVRDHCEAIWAVIEHGVPGEIYNVGGGRELTNLELVEMICRVVAEETDADPAELLGLIRFVSDRPGHDRRYAMDTSKIADHCGWEPLRSFETGVRETARWYLSHPEWVAQVRDGEYRRWIETHYGARS